MKMTNQWNRLVYRLWSPVYDWTVDRVFLPGRRRAFELLDLKAGEKILLVGVGTGADLPLLPRGVDVVGIDLSPHMLARARMKLPLQDRSVTLLEADAQDLSVPPGSFDAVAFNLILSVIPDGPRCFRENIRALKPGGRVVIFDKFAPSGRVSLLRRILNFFSTLFGTDITRSLEEILAGSQARLAHQEKSILNGNYLIALARPESIKEIDQS